jgi:hypothetical protein
MAHFARINILTKKVDQVVVAEPEIIEKKPDADRWVQTSYNTRGGIHYDESTGAPSIDQSKSLRKNYAAIGYTYDIDRDAFIPPKPYPSWNFNEITCLWEAPILAPISNDPAVQYKWDENSLSWIAVS